MNDRKLGTIGFLTHTSVAVLMTIAGLSSVSAQESADAEKLFKEGIFLREQGQIFNSINALETVLTNDPTLQRARLELAVAYFRALNYEQASKQAQRVLDDPKTPETVRLAVLTFLAQIKRDEAALAANPHNFEPSISLGAMYDNNVNVGPSGTTLPGGLVLTPGSSPKSDWASVLQAGVTHTYNSPLVIPFGQTPTRLIWQSSAGYYHKGYVNMTDFNLTALTFATGPGFIAPNSWRAKLNFQVDNLRLGSEQLGLYSSVAPTATWQLKNGELTVDGLALHKRFDRKIDDGRDSNYFSAGLSYGHLFFTGKLAAQVGVKGFNEKADLERFTNRGWEGFIGANVAAWTNGSVYGRYSYRTARYDGVEPIFAVAREEFEDRYELGAGHNFKEGLMKDWKLSGNWIRSEAHANVSIYTYQREVLSVNLARSF